MNKSQRIQLNIENLDTDKHIKIKLEQNVDTLEFLTMSVDTKDIYQDFNADFGVLVGRVIANNGIGVPNARISVFVPLTDEDAIDGDIISIYPYKTPRDKNNEGKRYNLLPRVGKINLETGIVTPKQPFGSFPIKEEIVTNELFLNVYKKYYKYTALTNSFGDYMIYGIPTGTQTIHLSVDITDIGKYSMSPAAMVVNLDYSPNLFTDNNTKIKPSNDLNDLPHIETQEISVDIVPFWGDSENFEIGITQQNFRIRSVLTNTFVIFGSAFTDGETSMWGSLDGSTRKFSELYHITGNNPINLINRGIQSKRIATITEKIYYYPSNISDEAINNGSVDPSDMFVLDPSEYSAYKRDGDFVFIINCNRNRIVIDAAGNEIPVQDTSLNGIFTKFRGFMTLEISEDNLPCDFTSPIDNDREFKQLRYKFKFPQHGNEYGDTLSEDLFFGIESFNTIRWRNQHYIFKGGEIYSVSRFHGTIYNEDQPPRIPIPSIVQPYFGANDNINDPIGRSVNNDVGAIETSDTYVDGNTKYELVPNVSYAGIKQQFGANWLNFTVYFPQIGYINRINPNASLIYGGAFSNYNFTVSPVFNHFYVDNTQQIAAGQVNTKWFARSDLHWTDFIRVSKEDIIEMNKILTKGFTNNDITNPLTGIYRNGTYTPPINLNNDTFYNAWSKPCPDNGGKENGDGLAAPDQRTYFYKGFDTANCIEFLISLGLV